MTRARPVGIVSGMRLEARIARRHMRGVAVACHGMGPRRAARAAQELVRRGASGLVSFGMAGGLTAEARPGLLVVPAAIHAPDGRTFPTTTPWRRRAVERLAPLAGISEAPLASFEHPLTSYLDKATAWARAQAMAADMESAAIAEVARAHRLPFIALRAIVDPLDFTLPPAAIRSMGRNGRLNPLRLVISLLADRRQVSALRELSGHAAAARKTLEATARAFGGIHPPDNGSTLRRSKRRDGNSALHMKKGR